MLDNTIRVALVENNEIVDVVCVERVTYRIWQWDKLRGCYTQDTDLSYATRTQINSVVARYETYKAFSTTHTVTVVARHYAPRGWRGNFDVAVAV